MYRFGIDLGGTTVKLGLFKEDGELVEKWEIPTRTQENGSMILPDIATAVLNKMKERGIETSECIGVGIGVPGPVDAEGVVHRCVNLGWDEFNVAKELESLLHMPVQAGNDANVAALGEFWLGGGKGSKSMVAITLGTGVGGGIILNGVSLAGATGAAGELGHLHVEDKEEEVCGCGNKGCLEQYASATGIVRLAKRRLAKDSKESVLRGKEITAKEVWDGVKQQDSVSQEIAEQFGEYLGKGLAAVADIINPEVIVIGGGVSKAGEILLTYVEKYYKKYVFHASRNVKITLATLGNDAGIVGAAKLN